MSLGDFEHGQASLVHLPVWCNEVEHHSEIVVACFALPQIKAAGHMGVGERGKEFLYLLGLLLGTIQDLRKSVKQLRASDANIRTFLQMNLRPGSL